MRTVANSEKNKYKTIFLIITSAYFLFLAYPNFDLSSFAFFAFVPFFIALEGKSRKEGFKLGFIFGLIFFGLTIYWLVYVSVLGYVTLILILSLYFAFFGFFLRNTQYASRKTAIITVPLLWIFFEYIRTYAFTGFGWVLLGYSQYQNLPLIQIADKTGVWGVAFIIMAVNVAIYKIIRNGFKKTIVSTLIALTILGISLLYGYAKLNEENPGRELKISVIQGNIPQEEKWDELFKESILTKYENLTKKAAAENPSLIIWPETALPGYIEDEDLKKRVTKLAESVKTPLLIGAPSITGHEKNLSQNSAILISGDGKILKVHSKIHLVPFGEYVPLEGRLGFVRGLIDKPIGGFTAGKEYTIFQLENGAKFGALICFEDIFPGMVRNFKTSGADFLVNMTNDAWFMKSSAPYQHAQASVFRAVENRVPVVRAANTGLSCFIDSRGRITSRVEVGNEDIFVAGYKSSEIRLGGR